MSDANNMSILCQFISPGHRAEGYGLMNMVSVFAGATVERLRRWDQRRMNSCIFSMQRLTYFHVC